MSKPPLCAARAAFEILRIRIRDDTNIIAAKLDAKAYTELEADGLRFYINHLRKCNDLLERYFSKPEKEE